MLSSFNSTISSSCLPLYICFKFFILFFFNKSFASFSENFLTFNNSLIDFFSISFRMSSIDSSRISLPRLIMPTCEQISWTSVRTCELRMIVSPFLFNSLRTILSAFTPLGSNPEVGSSRTKISGLFSRATHKANLFLIPNEYSATFLLESFSNPNLASRFFPLFSITSAVKSKKPP